MVEYAQSACGWIASLPWQAIGNVVLSLAAPLAAVIVAYMFGHIQAEIGRRQAETAALAMGTARDKLRLDLFEKRFAVFQSTDAAIEHALIGKKLTADQILEYRDATEAKGWLFGPDVVAHLNLIFEKLFEISEATDDILAERVSDHRKPKWEKRANFKDELTGHRRTLHTLMTPYLHFTEDVKL